MAVATTLSLEDAIEKYSKICRQQVSDDSVLSVCCSYLQWCLYTSA